MLYKKGLNELSNLLSEGKTSSKEIAESLLKRINEKDKDINSYITVDENLLLKQAAESDLRRSAGKSLSKFDGIPVAVKDNINTAGIRTTCASRILENFVPPFNATVYDRMLNSGMLLLGKTNMDEFAMGSSTENSFFGPVKNPYDGERVPGGSSGGSAASVSAFMAPVSLGSDTGGSIRQPAAFCGVTGIKPTYGRVSRYGLVAFASSLDQIGTFGRNVADTASLLQIIAGYDKKDSTSVNREMDIDAAKLSIDVKGLKLGVPAEYFTGIDSEIKTLIENKIKELEKLGAVIVPISLKYTEYAIPVYYLIATAEASSNLARYDGIRYGYRSADAKDLPSLYTQTRSTGFGKEVKRRIILGTYSLSSGYYDAYYLKALKGRALIIDDFKNAFSSVDAIIAPVTTTTAFKIGEMSNDPLQMYMSDILTISANLAGIPALSVPAGLDSKGLPVGIQIMGPHFQEQKILGIAGALENICDTVSPED
ncbi:MAG TPA: Asp-tRNA(Asn)/Glu-tRNA(Gln) amidotransferase subunit GatA [Spirochaetota bacterium]|nr:Asp-tRNA(Asn)/Glu-tRNA(Gln) amidotransferase subunit GatA [Spirochaetota bacterium]HPJ42156.1 Asp-tRNA(Asn)/Glu-tRNA(Gln) amidotransferase subunit GatA [Spirochaetota bacterium]HPR38520.1 Asp-tRNA(Asn)/Glu-tRNA(Gln) amidotransferase subunit GatA [Spirochaetota bacterium]